MTTGELSYISRTDTLRVSATLKDAPIVSMDQRDKTMAVESAFLKYHDGALSSVELRGSVIKKDGTPGARRGTKTYGQTYGSRPMDRTTIPDWLQPIITQIEQDDDAVRYLESRR